MPTYQYACTDCEHELEAVQKFTDDSLTECPQCTGLLRKVFSAVGVVFKGSGFYRNDSRSEKKAKSGASSGPSESSSASSSSSSGGSSESSSTAPAKKESSSSSPAKSGAGESAA